MSHKAAGAVGRREYSPEARAAAGRDKSGGAAPVGRPRAPDCVSARSLPCLRAAWGAPTRRAGGAAGGGRTAGRICAA